MRRPLEVGKLKVLKNGTAPRLDPSLLFADAVIPHIDWYCRECEAYFCTTVNASSDLRIKPTCRNKKCVKGSSLYAVPYCGICGQNLEGGEELCPCR